MKKIFGRSSLILLFLVVFGLRVGLFFLYNGRLTHINNAIFNTQTENYVIKEIEILPGDSIRIIVIDATHVQHELIGVFVRPLEMEKANRYSGMFRLSNCDLIICGPEGEKAMEYGFGVRMIL